MLVITIHFLNGAYYATSWGTHVQEGIPEWPPSVWRLMRVIITVWKGTTSELEDRTVWPIIKKIISEIPCFNLPAVQVCHTGHMPISKKRTPVLATFVATGDKPVHVIWQNVSLDKSEMGVLNRILANMHYFGRAESWCVVSASSMHHTHNCSPVLGGNVPLGVDVVNVLVPKHDVRFYDLNKHTKMGNNLDHIGVTILALQMNKYIDPPGGRWV